MRDRILFSVVCKKSNMTGAGKLQSYFCLLFLFCQKLNVHVFMMTTLEHIGQLQPNVLAGIHALYLIILESVP